MLAFQSLGVVYGDLSTSPLYVYKSTFADDIEHTESNDEIYGVLSFVFWTLTLVPLLKYVFVVLRADDNGEGGTFALYSLLCRHGSFGFLPSGQLADVELSAYKKKDSTATAGGGAASIVKRLLEKHHALQLMLLILALIGTCMVIGDGILTPAISGCPLLLISLSITLSKLITELDFMYLYQVVVFLCIKSVPVPYVHPQERFLVGRVGPKEYRLYRVIVRYGYQDIQKDDLEFERDLVCSIAEFIRSQGSELNGLAEETDKDEGQMTVVGTGLRIREEKVEVEDAAGPSASREILSPVIVPKKQVRFLLPRSPKIKEDAKEELQELLEAREAGMAFILGHEYMRAKSGSSLVKRLVVDLGYEFLRRNCRGPMYAFSIPHASTLEVAMIYHV
ncbi:hypothetical protein GW17_00027851 [Ensete ventricosum]|nr:hypothetical protein GW17_00027851 [Ensete ventricosum]